MRISVELVPRTPEALQADLETLRLVQPSVTTVNIPDLLRFPLRSWAACAQAKTYLPHAIPHLRALDVDPQKALAVAPFLEKHGIGEVLVVTGDAPADLSRPVYPTSSLHFIRRLKAELPGLKIYAALDPYRQGFLQERDYALQKLEAGASGFFTQPFFDVRLMAVYAELLPPTEIFWGVTTVTNKRTLGYWQTRNKAVFPAHFEPTLQWSRQLAREALQFVRERGDNLYFMPIRADLSEYLWGLLD